MRRRDSWWTELLWWVYVGVVVSLASGLLLYLLQGARGGELEESVEVLKKLPPEERVNTRFLSLKTIVDAKERAIAASVISFTLNSMSDSGAIRRPVWSEGDLLYFNLRWYAATEERYKAHWQAWEDVAAVDYVFHVQTLAAAPAPVQAKVVQPKGSKEPVVAQVIEPEIKQITVMAPWVNAKLAEAINRETASIGPILRAEQWLSAVSVPPFYYRMAQIPETEAEFIGALGIDQKTIAALDGDKGANVISQVAFGRVRRIISVLGPLGEAWQTKDVFVSRDQRDAVRQPLSRTLNPTTGQAATLFTYDAVEWIASQANGLHRFALYDAAGKRQDAVPLGGTGKSIARDYSEASQGFDGVVVPMLSCVRCHVEDGLRPFTDIQSTLPGKASIPDAHEITGFYSPGAVQLRLRQARERYALAVKEASEFNSQQIAEGLARLVRVHDYTLVSLDRAALELGVPSVVLAEACSVSNDPYLILLANGHHIHRDNWRDSFAAAATLLKDVSNDVPK